MNKKGNETPEKIFLSFETDEDGYIYIDYMWHRNQFEGKENIEYTRSDAFMEKTKEWLKNNAEKFVVNNPLCNYYDHKRAIENFKNYIKGENEI